MTQAVDVSFLSLRCEAMLDAMLKYLLRILSSYQEPLSWEWQKYFKLCEDYFNFGLIKNHLIKGNHNESFLFFYQLLLRPLCLCNRKEKELKSYKSTSVNSNLHLLHVYKKLRSK